MEEDSFLRRLDLLVKEIESCTDPAQRQRVQGIVGILLDFHRRALAQLMHHVRNADDAGREIVDALGRDELVASLLLLHDLHPFDVETRLRLAIERAAPQWSLHCGKVQLVDVSAEGVVRLRWSKTGEISSSAQADLITSIEQVVQAAAPDAAEIRIEGLTRRVSAPAFVPLRILNGRRGESNQRDPVRTLPSEGARPV